MLPTGIAHGSYNFQKEASAVSAVLAYTRQTMFKGEAADRKGMSLGTWPAATGLFPTTQKDERV